MSHSYKDLRVWQRAIELVTSTYRVSQQFPKKEIYGLTAQVRRAAVSIPSNIAEGQGRQSKKDFRHFLAQALEDRARDDLLNESGTIKGMLHGLMQSISDPSVETATRTAKLETRN
jgi:hypothetical protein